MTDGDIVLEDFEDMVEKLWAGTPAQQILAHDLTEQLTIDELADLLVEVQ